MSKNENKCNFIQNGETVYYEWYVIELHEKLQTALVYNESLKQHSDYGWDKAKIMEQAWLDESKKNTALKEQLGSLNHELCCKNVENEMDRQNHKIEIDTLLSEKQTLLEGVEKIEGFCSCKECAHKRCANCEDFSTEGHIYYIAKDIMNKVGGKKDD